MKDTMTKNWKIKEVGEKMQVEEIATALNVDQVIANLLVQKGITTFEGAKSFFRPQLSDLHDPMLMKDMDKAVARLQKAITANEKILVYGDYDVDGTTSVALVYSFLNKRHHNLDYYIPDRYDEGYGISFKGVDYALENGISLIIALDCGIKAMEKVNYAKDRNIDFIICDHHTPGSVIPDAIAVLDPKRKDCHYPYKELSGCGVGFKLLQAYANAEGYSCKQCEGIADELIPFLDLVTISIASDIVPINGENRILAYFGLQQINSHPRAGIASMIKISSLCNKSIEINDIVFKIGPRINAAGRMESGRKSVELLIAETLEDADPFSIKIDAYNEDRRRTDAKITEEALAIINNSDELRNKKSTVLFNPEWHKGVIGIVASRMIETYYRPTIVLTESNGLATGSARSVHGFDIYQAIEKCSDLLENFGGHMYAAGLSMKRQNLQMFIDRFEQIVAETISIDQLTPRIEVDSIISFEAITPKFFRILDQFQPFGPENMKPVFISEYIRDKGYGRLVGKNCEHLKIDLIQEDDQSRVLSGIGFKQAHHFDLIKSHQPFHVCYSLDKNEFMGTSSIQLKIRDIKPAE